MNVNLHGRSRLSASSTILIAFIFVIALLSIGWIFGQTKKQPDPPPFHSSEAPAVDSQPLARNPEPNSTVPDQSPTSPDVLKNFLTHAYYHGRAELSLAQMANGRAVNPEVKQFAGAVIADHDRVEKEMLKLAESKGIEIDRQYSLEQNPLYKTMVSRLSQLSGPDFDTAYLQQTVENHTLELSQYLSLAGAASDGETQLFAAQQVARVRDQLRRATHILRASEHEVTARL